MLPEDDGTSGDSSAPDGGLQGAPPVIITPQRPRIRRPPRPTPVNPIAPMRRPSPRRAGPRARAGLAAWLLVAGLCGCGGDTVDDADTHPDALDRGGRRHLVLESDRVDLLEGFTRDTRPRIWINYSQENLDRPELAVPMRRDSALRWNVDAPPGSHFAMDVARLNPHYAREASPCVVVVTALGVTGADGEPPSARVRVPTYPKDHSDVVGYWREGPPATLRLALPDGASALRIEVVSREAAPERGAVALLAPHLDEPRRSVPWHEAPLEFARVERLLGRTPVCSPDARRRFARRRHADGSEAVIDVCPLEAVANFTGHEPRPALAMLEEQRAGFDVDITPGTVLRTAVALDERVPHDARGRLVVTIDGEPLGDVEFGHTWQDLAFPLDDHIGAGKRLEFVVSRVTFEAKWNTRPFVDTTTYARVEAEFLAERLRAGLADPRLETATSVERRASSPRQPNVMVLHIETLRADYLPLWGGAMAGLTPNLDALARRSVVFDTAIAPSSWTLPSTVTLLTGLLPSAHGVVHKGRSLVPPDTATLAELARDAGIVTAGLVSNNLLSVEGGYGRGFSTFAELHHANAEQMLELAAGFLDVHAGQQALLWLHLMDPHFPYMAPGAWRDRHVAPELIGHDAHGAVERLVSALREGRPIDLDDADVQVSIQRYLSEIAYLDARIGKLLAALERLGLDDETALVVTADHGEEFFEHGIIGHGPELFDETVRVPLIVHDPAGRLGPPRRIDGVVSTAGLFATVLELLDVPYDRDDARPSLMAARPEPFAFTETNQGIVADGEHELLSRFVTGVRTADALLVRRHGVDDADETVEEYYDLDADPRALNALPPEGPGYERLRAMMDDSLRWSAARRAASPLTGFDTEWLERMREIGYIDGGDDDG